MDSVLLGGLIGITLAVLNFLASTLISCRVLKASKLTSIILALGGFMGRLGILSLLFYAVYRVKAIHFQTTLVVFLCCFTLCLILKVIWLQRQFQSMEQRLPRR